MKAIVSPNSEQIKFKFPRIMVANLVAYLIIFTAMISSGRASDPDALQDVCVAIPSSGGGIKVNGFACKDDANVTAADFFFDGLAKPGVINNSVAPGVALNVASVLEFPGLNTQGVSLVRGDFEPGGLVPPHTHPRATEIVFVLEGQVDVGFITTANKLMSKTIEKGEIFVFPKGLVHYQKNNADKPASLIAAFNSQLFGVQAFPAALFTPTPAVLDDVLAQAFRVGTKEIQKIKSGFAPNNTNMN